MKPQYLYLLPYIFIIFAILFIVSISIHTSKLSLLNFENKGIIIFLVSIAKCAIMVFIGAAGFLIFQRNSLIGSEIDKFSYNFEQVTNNYYKEVNKKELLNKAFDTVLEALDDPYTTSISNKFIDYLENKSDKLMVSFYYDDNNDLFIKSIADGSKASKENIKVNDKVLSINGVSLLRKRKW